MPHAKIKTHQAKATLDQLHAELAGKIIENEKQALQLVESMKHVEAVLKLLDPGYNVQRLAVRRRKPNQYFKRGTVFRSAVDAMRRAAKPMTVAETVNAMLAEKGITDAPPGTVRSLWGAVSSSLDNHKGKTVERVGEGIPKRWRLIS